MGKREDSITSLGNSLLQGFGLLAQALANNHQQPHYPGQGMMQPMVQFNHGNHHQPQFAKLMFNRLIL